jgi:hypothetical protein
MDKLGLMQTLERLFVQSIEFSVSFDRAVAPKSRLKMRSDETAYAHLAFRPCFHAVSEQGAQNSVMRTLLIRQSIALMKET